MRSGAMTLAALVVSAPAGQAHSRPPTVITVSFVFICSPRRKNVILLLRNNPLHVLSERVAPTAGQPSIFCCQDNNRMCQTDYRQSHNRQVPPCRDW